MADETLVNSLRLATTNIGIDIYKYRSNSVREASTTSIPH